MKPVKYDDIRIAAGRVDALAASAEDLFDGSLWDGEVDRQRLERCANLLGMLRSEAERLLAAVDAFNEIPAADPATWDEPK